MTYPPAPYGPPAQYAPVQRTDGLATASLVLGICAYFIPFAGLICALLALIFGNISMRRTRDNPVLGGHGMAVAGFILGLIGIAIAILFVVLILSAIAATPNS